MFTFDLPAAELHTMVPHAVEQYAFIGNGNEVPPAPQGIVLTESLRFFTVKGQPTLACAHTQRSAPPWCLPLAVSSPTLSIFDADTEEPAPADIKQIHCFDEPRTKTAALFSANLSFSAGWNHINDPAKAADFEGLKQPFDAYRIDDRNLQKDASCTGEYTYRALLVKKLHTWNNNHANGLETRFEGVPVNAIESLVIELKLHSERSFIPATEDILAAYPQLTRTQTRGLDKGMANIDVVLSSGKFRANKILTIDPDKYADQWLRITIPLVSMNYYTEVDYARTPTGYRASTEQSYTRLTVNAESQDRKTVQHLLDGKPGKVPLFKELDLSIRRIEYILKPD